VEERAARGLPTTSGALGPVIALTSVEAALPTLDSSVVSHLGCPIRASPVLKVVSLVAIVSREPDVGSPCPNSCVTGLSK